jgi:hypothetical protein
MGTRSWATLVGLSAVAAAGCTSGSGTAAAPLGERATAPVRGSSEVPVPVSGTGRTPVGGTLVRDWSTDPASSLMHIIGATLLSVRSSAHAGFDRIVWEFEGGIPGYNIAYGEAHIDEGGVVRSPLGAADMPVTFSAATEHDQAGRATAPNPNGGGLPVLREYRITGDYHGYVFYALGLLRTVPFRVYEFTGPDRLVVDFARR